MHLEVQEDKLDFQSITGRVFILLLICLSLFTLQGQYMIGNLVSSLSIRLCKKFKSIKVIASHQKVMTFW